MNGQQTGRITSTPGMNGMARAAGAFMIKEWADM
jgi:hypothetical protein